MQTRLLWPVLALLAPLCACRAQEAPASLPPALAVREVTPLALADTKNVSAFDGLVLAGQPTVQGLEAARNLGVKAVLNSRKDAEMAKLDFDERAVALGLGMTYTWLPWNGAEELTDDVLDRTREFLRTAPRPALYHCASANRVGAGFAAWRALDHGVDLDTALAEGKRVGMRTEAYEPIVRAYVARRLAERGR